MKLIAIISFVCLTLLMLVTNESLYEINMSELDRTVKHPLISVSCVDTLQDANLFERYSLETWAPVKVKSFLNGCL